MIGTTSGFIITPYSVAYALSFLICLAVTAAAWRRRRSTSGIWLALMMAAASVWTFFGMLEVSAIDLQTKILLSKMEYFGGVSTPVFFLLFAVDYIGLGRLINRHTVALVFVIPVITLALVATNEHHHLIWNSFAPGDPGSNLVIYGHGIWFWISNIGYTSLCVLVGSFLLGRFALQSHTEYRPPALLILTGIAAPWLAGFLYVFGLNPFPGYDLTRVAFALSGVLFLVAMFRWHFLDIVPIARNEVMETIPEGMIVLDRQNRVVDINRAAKAMIGDEYSQPIGRSIDELFKPAPWRSSFDSAPSLPIGCCTTNKNGSDLEISVTGLKHRNDETYGRIVFLRDITVQKRSEQALSQSEALYRSLFENMLNGFAYCRMLFEDGRPVDFIYLTVNQAFGDLTGLRNVVGKRVTEVIHGIRESDPGLFEIYGRVACTGKPEVFETYITAMDMWFAISVYSPRSEYFVAVFDVITERKKVHRRMEFALAEKELLLKEIHHRVKNNMQIISSLLSLQGQFVSDENTRIMLKDSQERIKTMALVYNKLYESADLAHISFKEYITDLVNNLVHSYSLTPGTVTTIIDVADLTYDLETAIPIGLIVNELVTNALKYAFPKGRLGTITISLQRDGNLNRLSVKDNGIGLPSGFDPRDGRSLGMKLVTSLAEMQLLGKLAIVRDTGTEFRIEFKEVENAKSENSGS